MGKWRQQVSPKRRCVTTTLRGFRAISVPDV